MSTNATLSIEERLMRLESLLERLIAATPAASNTAASAAVTEPSTENATATNTSNDDNSAFSNALEWKANVNKLNLSKILKPELVLCLA